MEVSTLKNVIVAGASGTIGTPIVASLLAHGGFKVSALSRLESNATFPSGVNVKRADLASHTQLLEAFMGQDVVICTLNDATAELQPNLIEAAFEAGVQRFMPNEWASHELTIAGTPMEDIKAGKHAIIKLLNQKVAEAKAADKVFHWTGINNGTFFDWALKTGFIDIDLPPMKSALIWDDGTNVTTFTNLSTVALAVLQVLTMAEQPTRDRLINIESFAASQSDVVAALEKATGETWAIQKTTTTEQLILSHASLESGDFVLAFYRWVRAYIFSENGRLSDISNEILDLPVENFEVTVRKLVDDVKT